MVLILLFLSTTPLPSIQTFYLSKKIENEFELNWFQYLQWKTSNLPGEKNWPIIVQIENKSKASEKKLLFGTC